MLQIRPVEQNVAPGLTGALGGAAGAAQGFMAAEDVKRKRALQDQAAQADQRRLAIAERNQEIQLQRFFQQQQVQRDRQDRLDRKDAGASAGFDAMRTLMGKAATPVTGSAAALPPEFDAELDAIASNPGMTMAQKMQALKLVGTRYEAAVTKLKRDDVAKKIMDEVAMGAWDPSNALGLEIDADGDGQPDPISETPALLLKALEEGDDPEFIERLHQNATRAMDQEKARIQRRVNVGAEVEQVLAAQGSMIPPEAHSAAVQAINRWMRDEYPQTEQGEKEFKMDFQAALAGTLPLVDKNGVKVYVPHDKYMEAEHSLKAPPTPEETAMERRKAKAEIMGRFLGEFRDDPESNDNDARWESYKKRMGELEAAMAGGGPAPQQVAPAAQAAVPPLEPGMTPADRFKQLVGTRDPRTMTEAEKAEVARRVRAEFGAAANKPGGQ
jgi:hypothetical protein